MHLQQVTLRTPPQRPHSTVQLRSRPRTHARAHDLVPDVPATASPACLSEPHPIPLVVPYSTSIEVLHRPLESTQYASNAFRAKLNVSSIRQSMSGRGNCYDNAVVESFFATLKTEEVEGANYETRQQAKTSIFSYLEGFYNAKRRHSSIGFLSPDNFERVHFAKAA